MTDFERLRRGMVDCQIRVVDVTDPAVLAAFLTAPREQFAPAGQSELAYRDARLPLGAPGRATMEPGTLARLVQLAEPKEGERALIVGCGLGYSVALFATLGVKAVGVEVAPELAAGARARLEAYVGTKVVEGPLPAGAPDEAPFDLIFFDGAVADGFQALGDQLAPDGRMVAPAGEPRATRATLFRKQADGLAAATFFDAYGPLLPGFEPREAFAL